MIENKYSEGENMRKQLVIIGIIALLVCVGLSGCQQTKNNSNVISLQELSEHLPRYVGKNITIEGYISNFISSGIALLWDSESTPRYIIQLNFNSNEITLYKGMYRITGVASSSSLPNIDAVVDVISAEAI